jgi:hypothetical protein
MYEGDICTVYRLLPKVTEIHVQPCAQSAVNVSSSAQAISTIVAAAINTPVTAGKDKCTVSLNYK